MAATARILVVEDERNVAETLCERLAAAGYLVGRAESVARGRALFAEQKPKLGLPDGNGFALGRELRAQAPQAAIIFLTAHGNPEDRVRGLELGADDYLTKP